MAAIYSNPTFLRMYWRAMQELLNGPLNVAYSAPLLAANTTPSRQRPERANPAENLEPWLSRRRAASPPNWPR